MFEDANIDIYQTFGIFDFFENQVEFSSFKETVSISNSIISEPDRAEYGDFQTNSNLANEITLFLKNRDVSPEVVIEPTCGKGNFIIASLVNFNHLQTVFGIEIYKPYVWECKFNIVDFFLLNPNVSRPDIYIYHFNVFDFNFDEIKNKYCDKNCLIIGNPPWVTNSQLGSLNSKNLPKKINFKKHSGIDAITGKGNFDIAEYITEMLIKAFNETIGNIALLVKNSVIKNIVYEQKRNKHKISNLEKYCIDSKQEFNVSVEASLFFSKLNSKSDFSCKEFNFYDNSNMIKKFGWVADKFVSDIENHVNIKNYDGESPFVWRQGIKHDCTKIMELDKQNGYFLNKLNEEVELESGLVYGFLKSSDLKNTIAQQTRKFTIITQTKVGQETGYIKRDYPKTYDYLLTHKSFFDARKSSIYNNKPLFSIFGVGDYSFLPYKIAISGLYKTFHFTLVLPQENKPVMLDDTCYFIGFEKIEFAVYTLILLNSSETKKLLESITFPDAKRTFTKDTLMRVDLFKLSQKIDFKEVNRCLDELNRTYSLNVSMNFWNNYLKTVKPIEQMQLQLFG
ncbi:MAG: SAM-dependent methyltransferase [Bacteroidales bacterium]